MPSKSKTPKKLAQNLPAKLSQHKTSKQAGPTGSPGKADSAPTGHNIPKGNREIIAEKLGCPPESLLVYREFDRMDDPLQRTIVAILPDGRKFKFYPVQNMVLGTWDMEQLK